MVSKAWGPLAVAFVWFTTHFGGGFASGRQLVDFFVGYGWYAAFTPVLAILIVGCVLYYAWEFSFIHKAYDYREWMDRFFHPYSIFFSNAFEIMYLMILLIASAVAIATGGTVMQQLMGTGYVTNTVIVAVCIFFLTIFGAEVVRRAATAMALLIIIGILIIYVANLFVNLPQLIGVLKSAPAPKGFGEAFWAMSKYVGFQACAMGAYIAVADALMSHEDVKKALARSPSSCSSSRSCSSGCSARGAGRRTDSVPKRRSTQAPGRPIWRPGAFCVSGRGRTGRFVPRRSCSLRGTAVVLCSRFIPCHLCKREVFS